MVTNNLIMVPTDAQLQALALLNVSPRKRGADGQGWSPWVAGARKNRVLIGNGAARALLRRDWAEIKGSGKAERLWITVAGRKIFKAHYQAVPVQDEPEAYPGDRQPLRRQNELQKLILVMAGLPGRGGPIDEIVKLRMVVERLVEIVLEEVNDRQAPR